MTPLHCISIQIHSASHSFDGMVLAVMDGSSDARLRPLLENLIIEKNQFLEFENRFL